MKKIFTSIICSVLLFVITFSIIAGIWQSKIMAAGTTWYACTAPTNWNNASGWTSVMADQGTCLASLGTPVAGDTAVMNSSSGNVTGTAAMAAASLVMTGYTGTLALGAQSLTVNGGTVTLGGTITATTGGLIVTGTETLASAGVTWPGTLNLNSAGTTTLLGNWINTGLVTTSATTVLNWTTNETLTTNGGLSNSANTSGTAGVIIGGGTWTNPSNTGVVFSNKLTLAGNSTLSGFFYFGNNTLTYTSGTITTTGSILVTTGAITLNTTGVTWNEVYFQDSGNTITLASNLATTWLTFQVNIPSVVVGAFNITTANFVFLNNANAGGLTFPAGQTINVTNSINGCDSNYSLPSGQGGHILLQSGTSSSAMNLNYTGSVVNEQVCGMQFTDVHSTGNTIINAYGSTLTRTTGILNINNNNFGVAILQ